jgi:PhnB protein
MYEELVEADKDKVMHSALENDFMSIMASDTVPGSQTTFGDNVRITLTGTEVEKLAGFYEKLSAGGSVIMPFEKQVWGQELGMLTDKFGTHWMVSVRAE